jgi:hypothetical protein
MLQQIKVLSFLFIAGFIVVEIFTIFNDYNGTRSIQVVQSTYHDTATIARIKVANVSVQKFQVKVKPKDVWDDLLLTNEDGNLLSIVFKIMVGMSLAWYIYHLEYDNIFTKNSLNRFSILLYMIISVIAAYDWGQLHTRDFWKSFYTLHGGDKQDSVFSFDSGVNHYLAFYMIPLNLIYNFYKSLVYRATEKSNEVLKTNS